MPRWLHYSPARLMGYLDEAMAPADAARVSAHLARCARCRDRLEALRRTQSDLRSLEPEAMPAGVAARVSERVRAPEAPRHASRPWLRLRPATTAVVLALLLGSVGAIVWQIGRPWISLAPAGGRSTIDRLARELHDRAAAGRLELGLDSRSPAEIRGWLKRRGAPAPALLVEAPGDRRRDEPIGATVHPVGSQLISVVPYRIDGRLVTLAVAGRSAFPDSPDAAWLSKRIRHAAADGRKSLVWSSGGETYALVSDLPNHGERACLICHGSERFRVAIGRLGR